MRRFVLALLACLFAGAAFANDASVIGIGGTIRRMKGKDDAIRMVREDVQLDVSDGVYDTVATFEFHNDSDRAVTATMGFPESGGGAYADNGYPGKPTGSFLQFATTVDGQKFPVRRLLTEHSEDGFEAFWVKSVSFTPQQSHQIVVRYRAHLGEVGVGKLRHGALYAFTGGNWHGDIAESRLTIRFHLPGSYRSIFMFGKKDLTMQPAGPAGFEHVWKDWSGEGNFSVSFDTTSPDWAMNGDSPQVWAFVGHGSPKVVSFVIEPLGDARHARTYLPPDAYIERGVLYADVYSIAGAFDTQCASTIAPGTYPPGRIPFWSRVQEDIRNPQARIYQIGNLLKCTVTKGSIAVKVNGKPWKPLHPIRYEGPMKLPTDDFMPQISYVTLAEAPTPLYVPLSDLMAALGGSVTLDEKQHLFHCALPEATVHNLIQNGGHLWFH